jgi:hypothetical protein
MKGISPNVVTMLTRCSGRIFLMFAITFFLAAFFQTAQGQRRISVTDLSGPSCNNFTITVEKSYDPVTDKTTYTYTITKLGAGNALSHWGFPILPCPGETITPQQFLSGAIGQTSLDKQNWTNVPIVYGADPSTAPQCTNGSVLKFEAGMGGESVRYFRLIVNGNWSIIPEYAYIKFGPNCCVLPIAGGGCLEEACVPPPPFTITGNVNNSPCPGATNSYSGPAAPSGETYTYKWTIVSGTATIQGADNAQTVSVKSPATCESYQLKLVVSAGEGCITESTLPVNVTDNNPPQFVNPPPGGDLGCNPAGIPGPANLTATDNCDQNVEVTSQLGSVEIDGCKRRQVRTYTATDDCGNKTTHEEVFTWTVVTKPVITGLPAGGDLGCNPTPPTCSQNVTASNECGPVTVTCTPGSVMMDGCKRTQTFTYTATACDLTETKTVTYTWTVVTKPVITGLPAGGDLGCNPTPPTCSQNVTASNECGPVDVRCSAGDVVVDGCKRTQTFTYTATACDLTETKTVTYTWTVVTKPVITGLPAGGDLGCNPTPPTCSQNVTASNECGPVDVRCSAGDVVVDGCKRTQVFTYTATACDLTETKTVTYTWTVVTKPVITGLPAGGDLGCNPTPPSCSTSVTASNECGPVTVTCTPGSVMMDGCKRTQTFTYTATACDLTETKTVTYTWTVVTKPVITGLPAGGDLGCNPTPPTCSQNVTASNECGPVDVRCSAGDVVVDGCKRTQTFTYTATACDLTETKTVTYTWTVVTKPVITGLPAGGDLGCNPTPPSCSTSVTASNECGPVTVTCTPGSVMVDGCKRTQVFTYTATACDLTETKTVTYTWTVVTKPVITGLPAGGDLGCNPTPPTCSQNVTASNECGPVDVRCSAGDVVVDGCKRTQTFTYTATACDLTETKTVTYTWTVVTKPVITGLPAGGDLGCNPTPPTCSQNVTASNECGPVDVRCSAGDVVVDGCKRTQVFTYTATACDLTETKTVTYTWTVVTKPVITGLPAGGDLGCNPTPPTCSQNVTASNECGPVDVRCSAGDVVVDGCKRTQVFTYTATACDLTETKTVTYTWKEDKEGPVITIADITAGECNTVRFEAQVSDDCGKVVSVEYSHPSGTVFPVGVTTVTVTAKDECGNVSTKTFTVTIIAKPTITLTAPEQPYCGRPGNKLTATATGSGLTYSWTVSGNGWIITDGANSATITYTSGIGPATFTVTVTDQYGCKATAELTLDCTPLGCSPGFWKNHKELWDNEGDYVPQRMPAGLRFTINTPLHVYFGIPNGSCGLMKDLTMGQAVGANGGGCNAFVRHAVSALLSSASFGPGVLYPSGTSDFTSLYNAIKFALSTCNCKGTLFSDLEKISESDHAFCSDLGKQIITLNQPGGSFSTGLSVKAFPNPYEEKVVFTINSKESGRATLEVYNMMGQKIATVFDGQVKGGTIMNITYNVPVFHRENLVYIFRQNGKSESGKVLSLQY